MTSFGMLQTAYSGLAAARAAMDVTGQNVTNVNTAGYTRQRVDQAAVAGTVVPGIFRSGLNLGSGVAVTGINRITDTFVTSRVRDTAATSGYWDVAASAASTVESGLDEPGSGGLSTSLSDFWAAWQDLGNHSGSSSSSFSAQGSALLEQANGLTARIGSGYRVAAGAWGAARTDAASVVAQVNAAAKTVVVLNDQLQKAHASGGASNELEDQRDSALTTLARLTGATSRQNPDGTVEVSLGGASLVTRTGAKTLVLAGTTDIQGASSSPVHVEIDGRAGVAVDVASGSLAGALAVLGGANATGTGGAYAETAKAYNSLATALATKVNALHATGTTVGGATGTAFFQLSAAGPAALGLTVLPTSASSIAVADGAKGAANGSIADSIGQIGTAADSPDAGWAGFVGRIGATAKNTSTQSSLAGQAAKSATTAQTSVSGVDLDEETTNLLMFQHAYQGAARVMTTVDEMLDTLINKTGLVGR